MLFTSLTMVLAGDAAADAGGGTNALASMQPASTQTMRRKPTSLSSACGVS